VDYETFDSPDRTDAVVLYALLSAGASGPRVEKLVRGVLAARVNGHFRTTQSNAWALLALSEYRRRFESGPASFEAGVWLGPRALASHHFAGIKGETSRTEVPMASLTPAEPLIVGKEGQGRLYFRVGLTAVLPSKDAQPIEHGFRLTRTLETAEGKPLAAPYRIAAGAVVRVHLRLESWERRSYVALADHLPAGLEPLDPRLDTTARLPFVENDWRWNHTELRDGGALAFADELPPGAFDFVYFARASTKGRFAMPAAQAEEMYAPETSARGAVGELTVE
jgi:uncharacterized protein YfaS (alpha-2-macroglobulin family)